MFYIGEIVTIHYPVTTHVRYAETVTSKPRQIVVKTIRDLVTEPLTPEEFLRRPYTRRSRWLIKAYEPARHQFRQFYIGNSVEYRAPSQLRIGLFDPFEPKPQKILYRAIEPTVHDRKLLARSLRQWQTRDYGDLQLRIYADDLRLVT